MRKSIVTLVALALWLIANPAAAQDETVREELAAKSQQAMAAYDELEFEQAKSILEDALLAAEEAGLDNDPAVASAYLNLGIIELAGLQNQDAAKDAFLRAVSIEPDIQIDVSYRTEAMAKMLDSMREQASKSKGSGGAFSGISGVDCGELDGIEHTLVTEGAKGSKLTLGARVGDAVGADRVSLFYRSQGGVDFTEVEMKRADGCAFAAVIPSSAMKGSAVHYYVAALAGDKVLVEKGSRRSPNLIEITSDDPLGKKSSGADVDTGAPKAKRIFVSLALGTGAGYVTGQTEVIERDVECCLAAALLHLFPEVGYYLSPQMSVSVALRMGFAVGADVEGHATAAPAGLLRLRYALAESGDGLQVSGAIGGGIIRHTIAVDVENEAGTESMTVNDTTASGPILIGGGLGYAKPLSSSMQLVGEFNGLAAIPGGVEELGTCPGSGCVKPNFGLQFDLNLGLLLAF